MLCPQPLPDCFIPQFLEASKRHTQAKFSTVQRVLNSLAILKLINSCMPDSRLQAFQNCICIYGLMQHCLCVMLTSGQAQARKFIYFPFYVSTELNILYACLKRKMDIGGEDEPAAVNRRRSS